MMIKSIKTPLRHPALARPEPGRRNAGSSKKRNSLLTRFRIGVRNDKVSGFRLKTLRLSATIIVAFSLFALAVPIKSHALFENAKKQACNGIALNNAGTGCDATKSGNTLSNTLATALQILSIVIGFAAVLMIIIGGLRFVLSGGDSNSANSARNTVLYAVIGLIIVFMAQIIIRFVLRRVELPPCPAGQTQIAKPGDCSA